MKQLEKVIKKENRKILFKKCKDALMLPIKKLTSSKTNFSEWLKDYIENRKQVRAEKLSKMQEERLFQQQCEERYEEYLNSYNPEMIGDREIFNNKDFSRKITESQDPYCRTKTTYFTELGNISKTHDIYDIYARFNSSNKDMPFVRIEYEGIIKDEQGKYTYAIASAEQMSFHSSWEFKTIRRDSKGKFIESESPSLYFTLESAFKEREQEYSAGQQNM